MFIDWNSVATMLVRILIAAVLGGIIGLEREKAQHNAGLRTHILICLGSVLIMCTGEYVFEMYSGTGNIDPARLGAQVVSGVGVLCAGTIMKAGSTIKGLTTATSLWCTACIGLAIGSGNIIPAAGTTLIVLVVLRLLHYMEKRNKKIQTPTGVRIVLDENQHVSCIMSWLEEHHYTVKKLRFEYNLEGHTILYCSCDSMSQAQYIEMIVGLSKQKNVIAAEMLTEDALA